MNVQFEVIYMDEFYTPHRKPFKNFFHMLKFASGKATAKYLEDIAYFGKDDEIQKAVNAILNVYH